MNKLRRSAIQACIHDIHNMVAITADFDTFTEGEGVESIEIIKTKVEGIKDEEQQFYDNMPGALQDGSKGEGALAAVELLQEVEDSLDQLDIDEEDFDGEALSEVLDALCDQLEEAAA
jgi:hypothetical protein